MIQEQQIRDWTENPVTIEFRKNLERELMVAEESKGLNAFQPFQPERTQEILANLNGYADAVMTVLEALEGDWSLFEVDENEL